MQIDRTEGNFHEEAKKLDESADRFNDLVTAYCCEGKIGMSEQIDAHVQGNRENFLLLFLFSEILENALKEESDAKKQKFLQKMGRYIAGRLGAL